MQAPPLASTGEPDAKKLLCLLALVGFALFVIALTGYPNLLDNERRVGAYALDLLQNGHWFAQRDADGDPISKPPLLTWLVALGSLPFGRVTLVSLYLPSAAATVALALILFSVGREKFGWRAGFLGALSFLLSIMADQQMTTSRYDGLFSLPVALAALAAYRGWTTGRGWTWFWLAIAFGSLVKGPLALILAASGLLAAFWEKSSGTPQRIRGSHWLGIGLFILIGFGWLALAYAEMGKPLIDKLIGRELVGHAVTGHGKESLLSGAWEPTYAYFAMFLPWSIAGASGMWRVWKHPSPDTETRRFERFLFCWFLVGLLLFSVAAHQRSRLIVPLIPAAALLAGRELARWTTAWNQRRLLQASGLVTCVFLVLMAIFHFVLLGGKTAVQRTVAVRTMAADLKALAGEQFPLTYTDSPFALQIYLNTMRPQVTAAAAAAMLRGSIPAFVATGDDDYARLKKELSTNSPAIYELARWPETGKPFLVILSNHPRLEWPAHSVMLDGGLRIETQGARLSRKRKGILYFENQVADGSAILTNTSKEPLRIRLRMVGVGKAEVEEVSLEPGETMRKKFALVSKNSNKNSG